MPRGVPNKPKTGEPQAIGQDRVVPRQCPAVGREVYDMHYDYNGVMHMQTGFLTEQAAWDWLEAIRLGAYEVAP